MSADPEWTEFWQQQSEPRRTNLRNIALKFQDLLTTPLDADGSILTRESCAEVLAWQTLDAEVMEAHSAWLTRTKAKFERHGWPWTTAELARRSQLYEHE